MLNNGVKETTATIGTGTITLTQVIGWLRFADGFAVGELASYAIKDNDNWEWGVGTVGASNTLARTTITDTLVAGIYTSSGATAIALASALATVVSAEHTGTVKLSTNVISTATTAANVIDTEYVYLVSGTTTLTLPTAIGNHNTYRVKNTGVATVTVATTSAQTIDGSTTASLPVANTSLTLVSDNANWRIV